MNRTRTAFIGVLVLLVFVVVGVICRTFGLTTETTTAIAKWVSAISAGGLLVYSVAAHYWHRERR